MPVAVLDALRSGGFDTVSLANNHGMDFGPDSLVDSVIAKRATDDVVVGIGFDEAEAYAPYSVEINGQRIAVIGATQVIDGSLNELWTATPFQAGLASAKRADRLLQAVVEARADHDTAVVFLHWGIETEECPAPRQLDLAAQLYEWIPGRIEGSVPRPLEGQPAADEVARWEAQRSCTNLTP